MRLIHFIAALALCAPLALLSHVGDSHPTLALAARLHDGLTPATIYASVGAGVSRNLNFTGPWTATAALPSPALALTTGDPTHWRVVYAGLADGVYVSRDGGAWSAALRGLSVRALLTAAVSHDILAATDRGVYRSDSVGAFTLTGGAPRQVIGLMQPQGSTGQALPCYAWSSNRVWISSDEGPHWSLAYGALPGHVALSGLAATAANPAVVYAASSTGVWRGANGKWTLLRGGGAPTGGLSAIVADAGHVFAASHLDATLYVSGDGGQTWTSHPIAGFSGPTTTLLEDAQQPGTLIAGDRDGHVLRSADGGGTVWSDASSGDVTGAVGTPVLALALVHRMTLPVDGVPDPNLPGVKWVPDNGGHTVRGPVLTLYQSTLDGFNQPLLGHPLTELFTPDAARPDVQAQIFSNMEVLVQGNAVTLAPLGQQFLPGGIAATASITVDARFLTYWKTNSDLFGPPVSPAMQQATGDGNGPHLVQYFRNARLEYRPEYAPYSVRIGQLGAQAVQELGWQ